MATYVRVSKVTLAFNDLTRNFNIYLVTILYGHKDCNILLKFAWLHLNLCIGCQINKESEKQENLCARTSWIKKMC